MKNKILKIFSQKRKKKKKDILHVNWSVENWCYKHVTIFSCDNYQEDIPNRNPPANPDARKTFCSKNVETYKNKTQIIRKQGDGF